MKTPAEILDSGILELYVYGALPENETKEISKLVAENPELEQEVKAIEEAMYRLSAYASPYLSAKNYERIKKHLGIPLGKVVQITKKTSWTSYAGWAAAAVLLIGLVSSIYKYNTINQAYSVATTELDTVKKSNVQLQETLTSYATANSELNEIRNANYTDIALAGQTVSPTSYAKVYWDKETQKVLVDVKGLPAPPEGKVYQVWALTLDPLTPTSIGILDEYKSSDTKIFAVSNVENAEAFGITLEPAGGSVSPTLEQLYTLGKV